MEFWDFSGEDLGDDLSDSSDVRRLSVSVSLDLVGLLSGEGNGEDSQDVVIGGLNGDVSLDKSLPLSDHGSQLISGEVHTVEVGEQVLTLNFIDSQLDLSVRVVLRSLQIGQVNLDNSTLQGIGSVLQTGGLVDQSLTDISVLEGRWSLDIVPLLSGKWVDDLLL